MHSPRSIRGGNPTDFRYWWQLNGSGAQKLHGILPIQQMDRNTRAHRRAYRRLASPLQTTHSPIIQRLPTARKRHLKRCAEFFSAFRRNTHEHVWRDTCIIPMASDKCTTVTTGAALMLTEINWHKTESNNDKERRWSSTAYVAQTNYIQLNWFQISCQRRRSRLTHENKLLRSEYKCQSRFEVARHKCTIAPSKINNVKCDACFCCNVLECATQLETNRFIVAAAFAWPFVWVLFEKHREKLYGRIDKWKFLGESKNATKAAKCQCDHWKLWVWPISRRRKG